MTYTQHFIVNGKWLASTERSPLSAEHSKPMSVSFVCGCCGEAWGKAVIEGSRFQVRIRSCPKHFNQEYVSIWDIPGSLMLPNYDQQDIAYNNSLPEIVWRRELECHLDWLESQNGN